MKNSNNIYRQGDVLIVPINSVPRSENLVQTNRVTLALGEVTGHHHSILDGNAIGYGPSEDALATYLSVTDSEGASLTHQEHDTIVLPAGDYKVIRQVEYSPAELRNVAD